MRGCSGNDRGSVIMEFLMVLPIYFALMGGTFWIGELLLGRDDLLFSDRLAAVHWGVRHDRDSDKRNQNDHTMFTRQNMWLYWNSVSKALSVTQTRALRKNYVWAQTVGGNVSLYVPQPPWVQSWLHGHDEIWEKTLDGARTPQALANAYNLICSIPNYDVIGMHSRKSEYNFLSVCLMRTKASEYSYRSFTPAQLCHECGGMGSISILGKRICLGVPVMDAVWYEKVYQEKYPYHDEDDLNDRMSESERDDAKPSTHDHNDYPRFPSYVLWSQ